MFKIQLKMKRVKSRKLKAKTYRVIKNNHKKIHNRKRKKKKKKKKKKKMNKMSKMKKILKI